MLRRYAIANPVYQSRQRDEVCPSLVSNYQPFGYLHLILWWAASAQVETNQGIREAFQPVRYWREEQIHGHRVILNYDNPAGLLSRPYKRTPVIPVSAVVTVINKQMSIQQRGKSLRLS